MIYACANCGGLFSDQQMEPIAGRVCQCPSPTKPAALAPSLATIPHYPPPARKCDCPEWAAGIEAINGPLVLQQIRNPLFKPTITPFQFCPWCGKRLSESESGESQ